MKKILNRLFILLFIFTIIPAYNAFAKASTLDIKCPEKLNSDQSLVCTLTGYADIPTVQIVADLSLTGLKYKAIDASDSVEAAYENSKLKISSSKALTGEFSLGTISFSAEKKAEKAKVELKNVEFRPNENDITTAIGSTSSIAVTQVEGSSISLDLVSLSISGYTIDFFPEVRSYNITIGSETSLDIKAVAASDEANVTIKGNEKLEDKSVITITVSDGEESQAYKIKITKTATTPAASTNGIPTYLIIIIAAVVLIIIIVVVVLIIKKKKSSPAPAPQSMAARPEMPRPDFMQRPTQPVQPVAPAPTFTPAMPPTQPAAQVQTPASVSAPVAPAAPARTPVQPQPQAGINLKDLPFDANSSANPGVFES